LLLDIMGTGGHAIKRAQLVHPDIQSVVVTGSGPIGLGVVAMARLLLGPDVPLVVTDLVDFRLELAKKLGALTANVGKEPLADGLKRHGLGEVDLAIDTSGRTVARRAAVDALAKRGVLVCVGHGEDLNLSISPDLIAPERAVLGSEYFRYDELPGNLGIFRANRDYLGKIATHRFPVAEIEAAFETFIEGNTGKVIVEQ
jgi:threonine 3-dehydrogenase